MFAITQTLDLVWPMGYDPYPMANLNFTSGSLVVDTDYHAMQFMNSNSSIADSNGNLLLYTNGCFIANAVDDTMLNGNGLNPDSCTIDICNSGNLVTQGCMILPDPNSSQYYLFHQNCYYVNAGRPNKLYYSIIDLSLDSGRGGVLNKNTVLYNGNMCDGMLSAVRHANGIDWWILVHNRMTDEFVEFLFTGSGIQGPFIQSIGPVFNNDSKGNSKFSPDGRYFATSTQGANIHIFNFNRCTGSLSNYLFIPNPQPALPLSALEFSPSGRFLYFMLGDLMYQFDMTASNIGASAQLVAIADGFMDGVIPVGFAYAQLAQDRKIYINSGSTHYLSVIDSPDSSGLSCNVLQHSIALPCKNGINIPSLPNYHLTALDPQVCDSMNTISNIDIPSAYRIYPNPVSDYLFIESLKHRNPKSSFVSIYNIFGQLKLRQIMETEEKKINLSGLEEGVYLIRVSDTYFYRFVKVN